jgi:hypothetical protein
MALMGNDWTKETDKVYIVLGCHRGGTSFVANCLNLGGVDFVTSGWRMECGHLVRANRDIIKEAGGTWMYPPSEDEITRSFIKHTDRTEWLMEYMFEDRPLLGMKDPRMALTADNYLDLMPDDETYLICIFRKPEKVAESINRVGIIQNKPFAEKLSREYYRRIVNTIKGFVGI